MWAAGLALAAIGLTAVTAAAQKAPASGGGRVDQGVHAYQMKAIDGSNRSLASYKGKALLIVNTASKCGFTPQYASLEALYDKYKVRGFEVLAFPANDFMGQEPGSDAEIQQFCTLKYDTSFPLFSKIHVKGKEIAPLYTYLTQQSPFPGEIEWNFTKFLIGPDGQVVARFGSRVDPMSKEVTGKLEALLAQK
jgi:glutathione peroxidase